VVLHAEVGDVVGQVDILTQNVHAYQSVFAEHGESHLFAGVFLDRLVHVLLDLGHVLEVGDVVGDSVNIGHFGSSHLDVARTQRVLVHDVQHMVEGRILLLRHQQKILQQHAFRHGVRLSQNDVILAREQFERIFQEVLRPTGEPLIDTEQVDHKGIDLLLRDLGHLFQVI